MDNKYISKIVYGEDTLHIKDSEARSSLETKAEIVDTVTDVAYDTTNKKITKTKNGVLSDVVTVSTIKTDLQLTKSDVGLNNVTNDAQVKRSEMGTANGVATLDSNGIVPSSQLPSFVDDVIEGYRKEADGKFYEESTYTTEIIGTEGKIYVDLSTNRTYRWSGSTFVQISESLALGETSSTAYRGDRGKTAYDHATNKGTALTSNLYKITTNAEGHVTAGTEVVKEDITNLGIPGTDTDTVTSINGKTGAIAAEDMATVLTTAGYKLTDTNTKVTSAANHYTPTTDANSTLDVDASGGSAATWNSTNMVTGVTISRDTKGHVTDLTVDSIKLPSNPNTDTKVTSVANHYSPAEDTSAVLSADASSSTAATWDSTSLVTGVDIKRDAKGHVVGVSVDSIKMPANPNTDENSFVRTSGYTAIDSSEGLHFDLDTLTTQGTYSGYGPYCYCGLDENNEEIAPPTSTYFRLVVFTKRGVSSQRYLAQRLLAYSSSNVYERYNSASPVSWNPWVLVQSNLDNKSDKSTTVSQISYDTTNKKLQKTINSSTTDIVTASTIVNDGITLATGDANGQVKIAGTNVNVNGLGTAAYKDITDTYLSTGTNAVSGKAIDAALDSDAVRLNNYISGGGTSSNTVDLDTITTPGTYYGNGSYYTNRPVSSTTYFRLEVSLTGRTGSTYLRLRYLTYSGKNVYERCQTVEDNVLTWGDWKQVQGDISDMATQTWVTAQGYITSYTDTKNTAGSTNTSSKIFLVGATSQAANPQTYSHDAVFVDANGRLNSAAPASSANDTTVATTKWVNDQGYITSYIDEKVKGASTDPSSATTYYPGFLTAAMTNIDGNSQTTSTVKVNTGVRYYARSSTSSRVGTSKLILGADAVVEDSTVTTKAKKGTIQLYGGGDNSNRALISSNGFTGDRTLMLPDKDGTFALTTDIPTNVSAFTNDAGYITSYVNTTNTAGSTDTDLVKLYLIGAKTQTTSALTYSNNQYYIGNDNVFYGDKITGTTLVYSPIVRATNLLACSTDMYNNLGIVTWNFSSLSLAITNANTLMANKAWTTSSDIRKKNIISNIDIALADIANAPLFNYKQKDVEDDDVLVGTSAQYWLTVLPNAVKEASNGDLSLDYGGTALASAITTARVVKEQLQQIEELKRQIDDLKQIVNRIVQ